MEQENLIWDLHRRGESLREIERVLGETMPRIRRFLRESGGIRPVPRARRIGHITAGEREEVSRGIAAVDSARTIAETLGRSPSTIAREIARNGGRVAYRAARADAAAYVRARRPKFFDAAYAADSAGDRHCEAECAVVTATDLRLASARVRCGKRS